MERRRSKDRDLFNRGVAPQDSNDLSTNLSNIYFEFQFDKKINQEDLDFLSSCNICINDSRPTPDPIEGS